MCLNMILRASSGVSAAVVTVISRCRPEQVHWYSTAHLDCQRLRVSVMVGQRRDSSIFRLSLLRSVVAGAMLPSQHVPVYPAQSDLQVTVEYQDSVAEFVALALELYHPPAGGHFTAGNIHCFAARGQLHSQALAATGGRRHIPRQVGKETLYRFDVGVLRMSLARRRISGRWAERTCCGGRSGQV